MITSQSVNGQATYNIVHQLGKDVDNQANWTATFVRRIQQAENKPKFPLRRPTFITKPAYRSTSS